MFRTLVARSVSVVTKIALSDYKYLMQRQASQAPYALLSKKYMGTYKTSTGLVGLAVDPQGKKTLQDICKTILLNVQVWINKFTFFPIVLCNL